MGKGLIFYQHRQLKTEVESTQSRTFFSSGHRALAEWRNASAKAYSLLLASDASHSVLYTCIPSRLLSRAYCTYGHCAFDEASSQGFNGERYETLLKAYALGQGYRLYSPDLMRFLAPDSVSPFGQGGLNSYSYCSADPVNRRDPDGHTDFSQMRGTSQAFLRRQARAREQQRTAQQRVEAFRQRRGLNRGLQPAQPRFRNALAMPDAPQPHERHRVGHIALATPAQQHAATIDPDPPEPRLSMAEAEQLYDELLSIQPHVQRFEQAQLYLAPGTPVTDDYLVDLERIRQRANTIRQLLGVNRLSWFHF